MQLRVETVAHIDISEDPQTFRQLCASGYGELSKGELVLRVDTALQLITKAGAPTLSLKTLRNMLSLAQKRGAWQLRVKA
jgi:hypothetical protein